MKYVFSNVFVSFIVVIIFKTIKFTSSVLFKTLILNNELSRVLQLPSHLSKLTAKG